MNPAKVKITLRVPRMSRKESCFALRLKQSWDQEPATFKQPAKLLVISNVQGNFQQFTKLLLRWKVINKFFQWTFGEGHLVILGDCLTQNQHVIECLWLIYSLEDKAKKKGGHVHYLLGNEEMRNFSGDWRFSHPSYANKTTSTRNPPTALYGANAELWRWMQTKNIIEKIGTLLFVSGGISQALLSTGLSLEQINEVARPYYGFQERAFQDPRLQVIYDKDQSPISFHGYNTDQDSDNLIDAALAHFFARSIVTSNPYTQQLASHFNGKWINLYSDFTEGAAEALFTRKKSFFRVSMDGNRERI